MVELQEQLSEVNSRIMSGLAVSKKRMEQVRTMSSKLGSFQVTLISPGIMVGPILMRLEQVQGGGVEEVEHDPGHHSVVEFLKMRTIE
jgi:hypothetical protein